MELQRPGRIWRSSPTSRSLDNESIRVDGAQANQSGPCLPWLDADVCERTEESACG
jgi:hypothetical protein